MNRLAMGRFWYDLFEDLELQKDKKMNPINNPKIFIYSGHDSTLVPLLCSLGLYEGKVISNSSIY